MFPGLPHSISVNSLTKQEFTLYKQRFLFHEIVSHMVKKDRGERVFSGKSDTDECFLFEYLEGMEKVSFLIPSDGRSVFYTHTEAPTLESINSLLKGSVIKFCLQLQKKFCLHASGIRIDNEKVILFIGRKGAGKSTISAYSHLMGNAVWCDDYSILEEKSDFFISMPGERSLKINAKAVQQMNISSNHLQSVFTLPHHWVNEGESSHFGEKFYFSTEKNDQQIQNPAALQAIFFLKDRESHSSEIVRKENRTNAFSILIDEIMLPELISKEYLQFYFKSVKKLLEVTPIFSIHAPDDLSRIHEVYEAVLKTSEYVTEGVTS